MSKSPLDRSFDQFARNPVDIDLQSQIRSQLVIERFGDAFFVGVEYENLPDFCANCQNTGDSSSKKLRQNRKHNFRYGLIFFLFTWILVRPLMILLHAFFSFIF